MHCYFIANVASYVPQVACTATSRWRQEAAALGTLSAVNTGEINANRLALAQATAAGPKRLAQRMIDAHTRNSQQVATWRADASAPPARAEMDEGKETLAMLRPMNLRTTRDHVADLLKEAQDLLAKMGGTGTETKAAR